MVRHTLRLALLALIGICCANDVPVISGVFMPNNITVNYEGAQSACAMHNSRLATMDEITTAFKKGYEFCKWGWTAERRLAMLRATPFLPCAGYNLGILIRDCPNIDAVFCVDGGGSLGILPIENRIASFENASLTCMKNATTIASKGLIEDYIRRHLAVPNGLAWYSLGVGRVQDGVLVPDVCYDALSQASAFCYNPSLADVIIIKDDHTVKRIIMGGLLALVFIILLLAAACMRGNKFICCLDGSKSQAPDVPAAAAPTWNKTSVYRRISHAHKGIVYDNIEKRPPAIRPDMSLYKTHYNNMAFDASGDE